MNDLVLKLLKIIDIEVKTKDDCIGKTINFSTLRKTEIVEKYYNLIPEIKSEYKSNMLTCLHDNSLVKQKNPAVNMLRQLLKCNGLKLEPKILFKGYNKTTGKKLVERYYIISELKSCGNGNDHGNDNGNDHGNDHGNENGNDHGNGNSNDHGNGNGNDNGNDHEHDIQKFSNNESLVNQLQQPCIV